MSQEPESPVLQMLRDMRPKMATKEDIAELKSDMHTLRADVAADFIETRKEIADVRKELGEQIVGLRRAVIKYHTSVVGHEIIIGDLEARVRRIEQHLELPASDSH